MLLNFYKLSLKTEVWYNLQKTVRNTNLKKFDSLVLQSFYPYKYPTLKIV